MVKAKRPIVTLLSQKVGLTPVVGRRGMGGESEPQRATGYLAINVWPHPPELPRERLSPAIFSGLLFSYREGSVRCCSRSCTLGPQILPGVHVGPIVTQRHLDSFSSTIVSATGSWFDGFLFCFAFLHSPPFPILCFTH